MHRVLFRAVQPQSHRRPRGTKHPPATKKLKKGKSAGVENIPGELVQAGGETIKDILLTICNKIWQTGELSIPWTQSLIITLPKKATYNNARITAPSA